MTAVLTMAQFATLEDYRASGHCAAVDAVTGEITLHGYRRYTPEGAMAVMKHEMDPQVKQARIDAARRILR